MFSLAACAKPPVPPLEEVLMTARQQHKPVVLEFYTKWCYGCRLFERKTLPDPQVRKELGRVLFARYDAEHGAGEAAAQRYRISSYPSILVVDGSGALCQRGSVDAAGVSGFLALLRHAEEATRSREGVQQLVDAHRDDPQVLLQAAHWHLAHHLLPDAVSYTSRPRGRQQAVPPPRPRRAGSSTSCAAFSPRGSAYSPTPASSSAATRARRAPARRC
jgi:thiol-disulfide isomerase/thioredoxin